MKATRCIPYNHPLPRQPGETLEKFVERYLRDLRASLDKLVNRLNELVCPLTGPTGTVAGVELSELSGLIESPSIKTYTLILHAEYASRINQISLKTASGDCVIAIAIDGNPVMGLDAVAVTSIEREQGVTGAILNVGSVLTLAVLSKTSPVDLAFTLGFDNEGL